MQATADESAFYGMLRSRDLTPFGFIRLDMRPGHAITVEPGTWAFEMELGYQNTWALSPEVERYLKGLEPTGRRKIGPAEVLAIQQLPGENYLIDLENATLDLTFHYRLSSKWGIYAMANVISYQGGFLDSAIEEFHDAAGFGTFGRPAVRRNQVTLIYDLKSSQLVDLALPTDGGFTDPIVGIRYSGWQISRSWKLSVEGAAKIGLQGRRALLSTGRTEFGAQASLQNTGGRNAFYFDAAAVYYAGALEPTPLDAQVIPTLVFGYERVLSERTNLNLQAYASKSVYARAQTDLGELLETKYQLSLGIRHRIKKTVLSFGITENVQNFNNTPDVGFQFGVAYIPNRLGD
jgi:hypothetical protein